MSELISKNTFSFKEYGISAMTVIPQLIKDKRHKYHFLKLVDKYHVCKKRLLHGLTWVRLHARGKLATNICRMVVVFCLNDRSLNIRDYN